MARVFPTNPFNFRLPIFSHKLFSFDYMSNSSLPGKMAVYGFLPAFVFSLVVIGATVVVSLSDCEARVKIALYLAVTFVYVAACAAFYRMQKGRAAGAPAERAGESLDDDIEGKLLALEEANLFFGASLKPADMFRLVASRIEEIVPFAACVMLTPETDESFLRIKYAVGANAESFLNFAGDIHRSLAARVLMSGAPQRDARLLIERTVFPAEALRGLGAAAAVPLFDGQEAFGVLVVYAAESRSYDETALILLEAAGARVAPLFAGSFAFERNLSNALTDAVTELPNERALLLVLENQLAESYRHRDERPLTVLAIDIHNFAELNQKFGHATGDKILAYAAAGVRRQLRQMDVLARSAGDEFLAVLPTAGEQTARVVVERIKRALVIQPFSLGGGEMIHFHLNFGVATFWRDGETSETLLKTARLRKSQAKSKEKSKILWFPKEFVN